MTISEVIECYLRALQAQHPTLTGPVRDAVKTSVRLLRGNGMGIKQIARTLEIGVGSVYATLETAQPLPSSLRSVD